MASETKAYAFVGASHGYVFIDLTTNTISPIIDPANDLGTTYTNHMLSANGSVYIARGSKIVIVDTTTQAVSGTISTTIGTIGGLAYDENNQLLWAMNSSGKLVSIDVANNHFVNNEVVTGVSSISLLREYNGKLYFWKLGAQQLYVYDPENSTLPLSPVYTSSITGGFSLGYGRSFDIEKSTGNFVLCSAASFVAPSKFEVVNGNTFTLISSGDMEGVAISNKCRLTTAIIHDNPHLDDLTAECEVTLTQPTANNGTFKATTNALSINTQGTHTVTWTYEDGSTQTQVVVIADVTSPVPNSSDLTTLQIACGETLTNFPTATDNCSGQLIATTTDPLQYETEGSYTITWDYTDESGNSTQQTQQINVVCSNASISANEKQSLKIYPNPVNTVLTVESSNAINELKLYNTQGKSVYHAFPSGVSSTINVENLPTGVYFLQVKNIDFELIEKIIIH